MLDKLIRPCFVALYRTWYRITLAPISDLFKDAVSHLKKWYDVELSNVLERIWKEAVMA
jgi:hypothetical protein